jgi:hypothetical protein
MSDESPVPAPQGGATLRRGNYVPSKDATEAVAKILSTLEGLNPRDRGYVTARLARIYKSPAKQGKTSPAKQGKSQTASKAEWKKAWEESQEYKAWMAAKRSPEEALNASADDKSAFAALQVRAFRKKGELQAARS